MDAEIAGIEFYEIINEPTACFFSLWIDKQNETILVLI
jgi:molecular chaperone DnaK (HSP70)